MIHLGMQLVGTILIYFVTDETEDLKYNIYSVNDSKTKRKRIPKNVTFLEMSIRIIIPSC